MAANLEDAGFEIRDQLVWIGETAISIALARRPLRESTVAANVLKCGTGAINVDSCRIDTVDNLSGGRYSNNKRGDDGNTYGSGLNLRSKGNYVHPQGRCPASVILTCEAGSRLDQQTSRGGDRGNKIIGAQGYGSNVSAFCHDYSSNSGGASRFFKCCDDEQEHVAYSTLFIIPPEVQCLDKN
jgi:hypothetical protein